MFNYLKDAFWVRWKIPGLGDLPVNFLAMVAVGALGFLNPGFWFLGLAAEAAFLWALAGSKRFQRIVDAPKKTRDLISVGRKREALLRKLPSEASNRFDRLGEKLDAIRMLYAEFAPDDFAARENVASLERLRWIFLKLLTAERHLKKTRNNAETADLRQQISNLQEELNRTDLSDSLRKSKNGTLAILEERYQTHLDRIEALKELGSDLRRIEAQFALAEEKAALKTKPEDLSFNLDLASQTLLGSGDYYGKSSQIVHDLDQSFEAEMADES